MGRYTTRARDISRRSAITLTAASAALAALGIPSEAGADEPSKADLSLWYLQPASQWTEALPLGNSGLGAMVFGGVPQERLQLNLDTVWAGSPYQPAHKDAVAHLAEARRLVFENKFQDAEALIDKQLMAEPKRQMSYQTIGSLLLTDSDPSAYTDYRRDLDLDTAIAHISYKRAGVSYTRELFISPIDHAIVMRLKASKTGAINLRASYETPQKAKSVPEGNDIVLRGVNTAQEGIAGKIAFESRARFQIADGTITHTDSELVISGATTVVVVIAIASNFKSYNDISADPAALVAETFSNIGAKTFDVMARDHVTEHRRLFRRVLIALGNSDAKRLPTDLRIAKSVSQPDPALTALYYQFGRYLMISSSRPGFQAAGLQGVWNDKLNAPWGGKYTININTEMNYWIAEPGNLAECVEPLVSLVKDIAVTGAVTAKEQYGARGWVCHHNTDIWRATAPIDGAKYGTWPVGGAWLCQHLWDHYDYSQDLAFLREIYPLMKGASQFFLDTLVAEPKLGWMVTCPSMSPEHVHPFGSMICAGPAMDTQIIRDLFDTTAKAARLLALDEGFATEVQAMRAKLAPDQIGKAGQLQEWLEDWDMEVSDIHHKHLSHLYAFFPSHQMNIYDTPKLAAAVRRTLEIRGDQATGWGVAWRVNLWARMGEGDHAQKILAFLMGPERTYPNMFDAHPPFQIDGNFGGANGISEMLLQSWEGQIMPLPALPAAWPDGEVQGLRARGGITIDMAWKRGRLTRLVLNSVADRQVTIRYRGKTTAMNVNAGRPLVFDSRGCKTLG